jgi:hypothetical protein
VSVRPFLASACIRRLRDEVEFKTSIVSGLSQPSLKVSSMLKLFVEFILTISGAATRAIEKGPRAVTSARGAI